MKVSNQNDQQHLLDLNKDLRRKIFEKQREIAQVKELYEKKREDALAVEEGRLRQVKEVYSDKKLDAYQQKQDQLKRYQEELAQTQQMLNKEKEYLNENHQSRMNSINLHRNDQFETKLSQANQETRDLSQQTREAIEKLKFEHQDKIHYVDSQARAEFNQIVDRNERVLIEIQDKYDREKKQLAHEHKIALTKQQQEFEKQQRQITHGAHIQSESMARQYEMELAHREDFLKQRLQHQEDMFHRRYSELIQEQESVLQRAQEKYQEQLNALAAEFGREKENVVSRAQDPFYQIRTLSPQIEDTGDAYIISLEIPEHEKENVRINANNRTVKVTLTRSFTEELRDEEGQSVDRSKRSEVFVKEFQTADILNSRDLKQDYRDGVIYFRLGKA